MAADYSQRVSCVFCDDPLRAGDVVFEDDRTLVLLHPDTSPRGHAMVVWRRHVENASDLYQDEWLHLAQVWQRAERVILERTGKQRAIIMKLGLLTPHLHVHIYPMSDDATREQVFAAIDGKAAEERDDGFIAELRRLLTHPGD